MIAAIYARKSTDQNGIANDEKSVTRQIEHAKAYAAQNGWAVYDEYLYVDDGISGAEFVKRPGFLRLMNALKPKPAFQVLIMSEESRLGREQIETAYALKQIITAGVRVFYYLENRERTLESPTDKLLLSVTAFADEMEREKARQRTHDALVRKARAGYVAGGSVYGYDNIEVTLPDSVTGKPKRLHVERRINEAEAAVIREIFEKAAAGWGPRRIAHDLNARHVPAPPPRRAGRPRAWAPSTIYAMLTRSLYRGEVVWNRTRKRNAWGIKHQTGRAEAEWVQLEVPALRIVPEPLWQAVRERFRDTRASYLRATNGQLWGRPANGIESRYLLTGLAQCGLCGGSLIVHSRASGSRRANAYLCSYSHLRGKTVCPGGLLLPMDLTNEAILKTVEQDILHPEVVRRAMRLVISELNAPADTLVPHRTGLQAELTVLEQELSRLTAAVAQGRPQAAPGRHPGPRATAASAPDGAGRARRAPARRRPRPSGNPARGGGAPHGLAGAAPAASHSQPPDPQEAPGGADRLPAAGGRGLRVQRPGLARPALGGNRLYKGGCGSNGIRTRV
jgi:DNA invertase Pin-like site-specific DNA recombinase